MDTYYVYIHTNKINGKRYIGITKQSPEDRWGKDGANYKNKCPHFWNAIQKYGWNCFEHVVAGSNLSKEKACEMEIDLISRYDTQNRVHGYNILSGGTAPSIPAETRAKMSLGMMGNKNGLGHPCSPEKRKKISDAQKGKVLTPEHRANISKAKMGVSHAPPSAETRRKISEAHASRNVYCSETDTVYRSVHECAGQLGLYPTNVCKCCRGKLKSTGGYHVRYYS